MEVDDNNNTLKEDYKLKFVWINVIAFIYLHVSAVYGLYLSVTSAKASTSLFSKFWWNRAISDYAVFKSRIFLKFI
jgi:hypothetical protein